MSVRSSAEQGRVGFQKGELPHYRSPRAGPGMLVVKWHREDRIGHPGTLALPPARSGLTAISLYALHCQMISKGYSLTSGPSQPGTWQLPWFLQLPLKRANSGRLARLGIVAASCISVQNVAFETLWVQHFFYQIGMTAPVSLPSTPVWIPTLTQIWNHISGCSWHTCA